VDVRSTEHCATVDAPAADVYDLLADVGRWPLLFAPTIHAERLDFDGDAERIRICAIAGDDVKAWTSRRTFDPSALRIKFRQELTPAPAATMSGEWRIEPKGQRQALVRLRHTYSAIGDDPEKLAWIAAAVDRNSTAELRGLAELVAGQVTLSNACLEFADTVTFDGSAEAAYEFLRAADRWPDRLPHVAGMEFTENPDGVQWMTMQTKAPDGDLHTTRSVRICEPGRIRYKQVQRPRALAAHCGEWTVTANELTSRHRVRLDVEGVRAVLGPDANLDTAAAAVKRSLSANSRVTLSQAATFAGTVDG
jgi:ribosome-associated toxin RatA of RatAB toxin-antitoxin module